MLKTWQRAAQLIRRFAVGRLTNHAFEAAWEKNAGNDRVLEEIWLVVSRFYDDLHEHRLSGPSALQKKDAALFERCALFLETEAVYEWPVRKTVFRWRLLPRSRYGDSRVWPFFRASDYLSCAAAGRSAGTA